ncbi:MAG TPA: discoidin domain-containing protein, partial [Thermoleophilia bacterium]|nr:discoidin domain-containing protein [Thermoleophilia bacterium]
AALGLTAAVAYRTLFSPQPGKTTDGGAVTTGTTATTSSTDGDAPGTTTQTTSAGQPTTSVTGTQAGRLLKTSSWMASSTLPAEGGNDYGAANVADGDLGTCWSEGIDGQGAGEWVRLAFDKPTVLTGIEIANGYQKDDRRFSGNPRVAVLRIEYSTGSAQTVQLHDSMGFQTVTPSPTPTQWVKFVVESTYPGELWQDTSISEIRLYESQ